jgi:hypothetical protein
MLNILDHFHHSSSLINLITQEQSTMEGPLRRQRSVNGEVVTVDESIIMEAPAAELELPEQGAMTAAKLFVESHTAAVQLSLVFPSHLPDFKAVKEQCEAVHYVLQSLQNLKRLTAEGLPVTGGGAVAGTSLIKGLTFTLASCEQYMVSMN